MFTTAAKNAMLDSETLAYVGAHTAFTADGSANEVSGGSPAYARKAITVAAAASAERAASTQPVIDIPASTTVRWISVWTALAGTCRSVAPCGGSPKKFVTDATNNKIKSVAHGYDDDDTIVFYNGTPPAPLVEGTVYFVNNKTTDDFEVAATLGGAAINLTAESDMGCILSKIVPVEYSVQGTLTVNTAVFNLTA